MPIFHPPQAPPMGLIGCRISRSITLRAMLHPHTRLHFVSDFVGYGVIATQPIPRGTITWVRDRLDRELTLGELAAMPEAQRETVEKYSFHTPRGTLMLTWDLTRYMNHSCAVNCLGTHRGFEIAVRDIAAGEALTSDYGNLMYPNLSFDCACGEPSCRARVTGQDGLTLAPHWDSQIRLALTRFHAVPQPLAALLPPNWRSDIDSN